MAEKIMFGNICCKMEDFQKIKQKTINEINSTWCKNICYYVDCTVTSHMAENCTTNFQIKH